MKKSLLNLLCVVFGGLIIICGSLFAERMGIHVPSLFGLLCGYALITLLLFSSAFHHILCDYDWAEELKNSYLRIPQLYRRSFGIIFGFINLAFLFHTINFMWGNQDWHAIRFDTDVTEGLADGAFSAYWLQAFLFDGKILPVINNLLSFIGLSLGAVLLCNYWQLPKNCKTYTIVGLFFAVTPYTLSWLYFAKNTLGNLWLPCIITTALLLSDTKKTNPIKIYLYNLLSVLLLIIALGTHFAALQFTLIAIFGLILNNVLFKEMTLKTAFNEVLQSLVNLFSAVLIYLFIFVLLKHHQIITEAQFSSGAEIINRLPLYLQNIILQFVTPLPFIDISYKSLNLVLVIVSIFAAILKGKTIRSTVRALALLPLILLCSQLSSLVSVTSLSEYPAHIDFFALPMIYVLALSILIKLDGYYLKRFGYILAVFLIFMSFVRVAYAQKVWKFGWDAETKLSERIITRLEKLPEFNIEKQYKLLQIGEQSLRFKYYQAKPHEKAEGSLLGWSYYPATHSKDAYNFYYQTDFIAADADPAEAVRHTDIKEYLLNQARPWPHQESIRIIGDYIILIMDDLALNKIQRSLEKTL